ncbi:MAG: hypothetical protein ACREEM_33475 [Blastocatellia bacterium]
MQRPSRRLYWAAKLFFILLLALPAATEPMPAAISAGGECSRTSVGFVPLNDLGTNLYLGQFMGGLYSNGENTMPAGHARIGLDRGRAVQPLDVNGNPSPSGKYVLLSVGYSGPNREFCSPQGSQGTTDCSPQSFMGQAAADPVVNHATLAIVNGAKAAEPAANWDSPADANYDRVRDSLLVPNGLSEKQVQAVWLKQTVGAVGNRPVTKLPAADADAFTLKRLLGSIVRALKVRYPNLKQVFLSSRVYGGYITQQQMFVPEPESYESGFGVKWLIEAQIRQMETGEVDSLAGDLNYNTGIAPWLAWGPYFWADGAKPRSDGLTWACDDFITDGAHTSASGTQKAGQMLLDFFKTESAARPWFLASGPAGGALASVSAASFSGSALAPEAIIASFGSNLATATQVATATPLPTTLAGTTVKVRDNAGAERLAPLFFVSPTQVNYQIPAGTAAGTATITITGSDGSFSTGSAQIALVAPGLFAADASGRGLAAATALRVRPDGSQQFEAVARFDPAQNKFVAIPIDLGPESDQVFLILFGTGIRYRSSLSAAAATIGGPNGVDAQVTFAGAQGGFVGLDQVNARLPRSLIGRGEVDITLMADGQAANTVKVNIK